MKFLKDPIWQFIGAVIGIIAVMVTLFIYIDQRPSKKLRVEILSNSSLVSVNNDIAQEIQILYKNSPVQSLSLILLKFENSGNEPITENDFSDPIQILLSPNSEIGEVTIQETRPLGIQLTPTVTANNQIYLAKALLNPGDQVILRILVINNDGTLNIKARIAGISNIEIQSVLENGGTTKLPSDVWVVLFFIIPGTIFFVGLFIWNSQSVVGWRKEHLGFDPARNSYLEAQEYFGHGPFTPQRMRQTIRYLRNAFSWDQTYVKKTQDDPIFTSLRDYELYKELIDEFTKLEEGHRKNSRSSK